jgi:hypothetical protein
MKGLTYLRYLLPALLIGFHSLTAQTEYKVYPGDTNNDAVVNVQDLLPVGIAFNSKVNPREEMDIDWSAKLAVDFLNLFLPNSNVNYVHINTNGDDIVNEEDLDAIVLNYDSTVTADLPPPWTPEPFAFASYCPSLKIVFDRDSAFVLDTFAAEIRLDIPIPEGVPEEDGILGVSFSFNYPLDNINDKLTRIVPDPDAADLMFVTAHAQQVSAVKTIPPGRGEIAAAGRGENAFVISRVLGKVNIVVEDMIFRSFADRPFWIDILPETVLMVNKREERFEFCLEPSDTIVLSDRTTAVKKIGQETAFRLWPNPNSGAFHIELPAAAQRMQVISPDGKLQWSKHLTPQHTTFVQLPALPAGIYFVLIETPRSVFRKSFLVIKR